MAEELTRKRRQRAGHRSSAKRIISSVIDVLGGGDISQVREHEIKLKQQRDSLQQKLNTLRQLDAEILDLVAEEEIEGEIERADLLEENVQLAIANIENALSPKVVCSNVNTKANMSESMSANEVLMGSNIILRHLQLQRRIPLHLCGEILKLNAKAGVKEVRRRSQ